jgi:hypothetical protein
VKLEIRCAVWVFLVAACMAGADGCAIPIIGAPSRDAATARGAPARAPRGRAWAGTDRQWAAAMSRPEACYAELDAAHATFERIASSQAHGVQMPARLLGPIGGITVLPRDGRQLHAILDCRLALALLSWAPTLREAGVTSIDHYSIYRPGAHVHGSGHTSGHARGLAIDAARFHLRSGAVLDVLTDWEEREHGSAPCPRRPEEAWQSRLLRGVVCDAVELNLFQIVITPHHDRAHENHVHLELKPEVGWSYVR